MIVSCSACQIRSTLSVSDYSFYSWNEAATLQFVLQQSSCMNLTVSKNKTPLNKGDVLRKKDVLRFGLSLFAC